MLKVFSLICVLFFLISSLHAQTSPIYYVTSAFVFGALDGTKEGMKLEDKYRGIRRDPSSEKYNNAWHRYQFLSNISSVGLGFNIALYSYDDGKINWLKAALSTLLSGVIFYNTREMFMNVTRGRDLFAPPVVDHSGMDQLRFFRIPIILVAVGLNMLLLQ
ncbi:MAG: hypothetical protein A2V93_02135 [Ignavibacteria bacterium RBG_16_34_14]|nr:MAG: hypothetical protein A2V93_02135 [Ignavibacteria bacterium RBG_16_34_14]